MQYLYPCLLVLLLAWCCPAVAEPVRYIVDTDLASDCDDAGALAMIHALADNGEVEIVAVMISTGGPYGGPAASAINAWYCRDDIPIGVLKDPDFWVGGSPDKPSGALNYERYNRVLAERYQPKLKSGDDAPDATVLYRRLLAKEADGGVVINTIGPLINLRRLLESRPDDASPLDGVELVKRKVRELVVCGGANPKGTSSNFSKQGAGPHAKAVIDGWPTPIVFVGNEVGGPIKTGWDVAIDANAAHPARLAYALYHNGDPAAKRASWDQAGALYAIRGLGDCYEISDTGHLTCDDKGHTEWSRDPVAGRRHSYLRKKPNAEAPLAQRIESLMNQVRRTRPVVPPGR